MSEKLAAEKVMDTLRTAGFEAYLVGGCVRDFMLTELSKIPMLKLTAVEPHDFDVTTNATPEQMTALFEKTIPVGAAFGVVVAMVDGYQIQVATYRADGAYTDGRRPDEVQYSLSAKDDVTRRDFTMNGLLMTKDDDVTETMGTHIYGEDMVIDHVGGVKDIKAKLIRCIGDPHKRFEEDALRMMRAVRFAATLGFDIEAETYTAIVANVERIKFVSRERIAEELFKLLTAKFPLKGLVPLATTGLLGAIFPYQFRFQLTLMRFAQFPTTDRLLALAMFLADFDGNADVMSLTASAVLESLKLSSDDYTQVLGAVMNQHNIAQAHRFERAGLIRLARKKGVLGLGVQLFGQSLMLLPTHFSTHGFRMVAGFNALTPEDLHPTPMVTGKDLIEMGLKPGPIFSDILFEVETVQLNGGFATREEALAFAALEAK
jgi:tRNA nucleotidyltransferase/poly(A) polymerase